MRPDNGHRFGPGNPGKPKGSRNKLAESFLDSLYRDFQANGDAVLIAARAESPLGYCKMVASLLPQKIQLEQVASAVTDDELLAIIRGGSMAHEADASAPAANVDGFGHA
jgi:hypothetical protein